MRVVVDVGCARYGGDYSIERLLEEFRPDILYGFDPNESGDRLYEEDGTTVVIHRAAAWTEDGQVGYSQPGLGGFVSSTLAGQVVPAVDLARFIRELPEDAEVILKIDAEGAEYGLLEHLIRTKTDQRLTLAWVEWHGSSNRAAERAQQKRRQGIEASIRCELIEWCW
jgi:FkbM family methyltransferase